MKVNFDVSIAASIQVFFQSFYTPCKWCKAGGCNLWLICYVRMCGYKKASRQMEGIIVIYNTNRYPVT